MQDPNSITINGKKAFQFTTPNKSETELRREKKKKMTAFKTFLGKIETSQDLESPLPVRKFSGDVVEESLSPPVPICKICKFQYKDKGKQCLFCHDIVCVGHIRKKRRDPVTNKFTRICDICEDKFLYKRHLKNQMKLEESMVAQELLLESKSKELEEMIKGKQVKFEVLKQKNEELTNDKKKNEQKLKNQEQQLEKRTQKLTQKEYETLKLDNDLKAMQKKMAPSLEIDYETLVVENEKITRELVIHQKICQDVIKAFSQREKAMYQEYYEWQQDQKLKMEAQNKKQECIIY